MEQILSYQFEKHFTIDEANALLPYIRRLFAEVQALLSQPSPGTVNGLDFSIHPADSNGNGNGNGQNSNNGNGNNGLKQGPYPADYAGWSAEKRHEAAYRLVNALQTRGIVIQDVERGLIDFPSIMNGQEVFLCYELSDGSSLGYFHNIDAGYAGRKPISESKSD